MKKLFLLTALILTGCASPQPVSTSLKRSSSPAKPAQIKVSWQSVYSNGYAFRFYVSNNLVNWQKLTVVDGANRFALFDATNHQTFFKLTVVELATGKESKFATK